MRNFVVGEFQCKCCGDLPENARSNEVALVDNLLDQVRDVFGHEIKVNSGYRCPRHNAKVGGVKNSQHLTGEAADICAETRGYRNIMDWKMANQDIVRAILKVGRFDQLILENVGEKDLLPTWVHVSFSRRGNRGQVMKKVVGKKGYSNLSTEEICKLLGAGFITKRP